MGGNTYHPAIIKASVALLLLSAFSALHVVRGSAAEPGTPGTVTDAWPHRAATAARQGACGAVAVRGAYAIVCDNRDGIERH